jgi:hypothetical protein
MPKSKASAFFSVLLVFASGAAMGAVGYRLYAVKAIVNPAAPKRAPEDYRKLVVSSLKSVVKLDAEQSSQVQKIYDDEGEWFMQEHKKFDVQMDQIHHEAAHERDLMHEASVTKIKAILRADQLPLYEKWLADRAADRKRRQQQEQQHHGEGKRPPPPPLPLP